MLKGEDMNKSGFTLAEVLITLAVIGIVAALTLPSLISNHRKRVVVTKLQKNLALVQSVIKRAEVDNGFVQNYYMDCNTSTKCNQQFFHVFIEPYLKIVKTCIPSAKECWSDGVKSLSGRTGYLTNVSIYISFILEDGQSVYLWSGGFIPTSIYSRHAQIWFDIDGSNKGANTLGKDIFGMYVDFEKGTVNYAGMEPPLSLTRENLMGQNLEEDDDNAEYGCNKDLDTIYSGRFCGGLIENDGWQIKDDYPVKF